MTAVERLLSWCDADGGGRCVYFSREPGKAGPCHCDAHPSAADFTHMRTGSFVHGTGKTIEEAASDCIALLAAEHGIEISS